MHSPRSVVRDRHLILLGVIALLLWILAAHPSWLLAIASHRLAG